MHERSIFLSHNHADKPFVRRIAADLAGLGAQVWVDEAELNIGDSLLSKISAAIDQMQFLGVVLSPESVASSWVQHELEQAMTSQLSARQIKVLPLLLRKCDPPSFIRGKLYADFTGASQYDHALKKLARTIGLDTSKGTGGRLFDPYASEFGRQSSIYSRPVLWHCTFCGEGPMPDYNDYLCTRCKQNRPFVGGSCTMCGCHKCRQMNLLSARFCEWCGANAWSNAAEQ